MPLVRTGQNLLIEHKLPDKNPGMFIRARLFDDSGAELAASPVTLPHKTDGLYRTLTAVPMPGVAYVTAIAAVYYDSGYTLPAEDDYTDGVDTFERIDDLINTVVPRSDVIYVQIREEDRMDVNVSDPEEIEVKLDSNDEIEINLAEDGIDVQVSEAAIFVTLEGP